MCEGPWAACWLKRLVSQYHREIFERLYLNYLIQLVQVQHQRITIEEQLHQQCLILRRCRYLTFNGQIGDKATDLCSAYIARVLMMVKVKVQKTPYPVDVLPPCTQALMPD